MIEPAVTNSPPKALTPRRCELLSRPLRLEPRPFLCAISVYPALDAVDRENLDLGEVVAISVAPSVVLPLLELANEDLRAAASAGPPSASTRAPSTSGCPTRTPSAPLDQKHRSSSPHCPARPPESGTCIFSPGSTRYCRPWNSTIACTNSSVRPVPGAKSEGYGPRPGRQPWNSAVTSLRVLREDDPDVVPPQPGIVPEVDRQIVAASQATPAAPPARRRGRSRGRGGPGTGRASPSSGRRSAAGSARPSSRGRPATGPSPDPAAARAVVAVVVEQARPLALAGHLDQAQLADRVDLGARAVGPQAPAAASSRTCRFEVSCSMSMKSMTMMPPMSRRRSWRAISLAASRLVLRIVSSGASCR